LPDHSARAGFSGARLASNDITSQKDKGVA
jgi:hypothetical protein